MTKATKAKPAAAGHGTSAPTTKRSIVIALLSRPGGASLAEIVTATNWLAHTARAALTGLKKQGHVLTNDKADGIRRYRITGGTAQ